MFGFITIKRCIANGLWYNKTLKYSGLFNAVTDPKNPIDMKKHILSLLLALTLGILSQGLNAQTIKTVGVGGDYNTLYDAIDDVRQGNLIGDIEFQIISNITETSVINVRHSGYSSWDYTSIIVYPTGGDWTITNNTTTDYIFTFWGCQNVTIDGRMNQVGSTASLTFESTTGQIFQFYYGAKNNTIRYCKVKGNSSSTMGLIQFNATSGSEIANNIVEYCTIGGGISTFMAIGSTTQGGISCSNNTISYCSIVDVWNPSGTSTGIRIQGNSTGWDITHNNFYQTAPCVATAGATHYGIWVEGDGVHTIDNNHIGGSEPMCGGTAWTISGNFNNRFIGIYHTANSATPSSISNNTINNFNHTNSHTASGLGSPGIWCGIHINGGNAVVDGNTIGSTTETDGITVDYTGTSNVNTYGIAINSAVSPVNITNNSIGGITLNSDDTEYAHGFCGIYLGNVDNANISGNTIGSTTVANSIICTNTCTNRWGTEQNLYAIQSASHSNLTVGDNTISNLTNSSEEDGSTMGIHSTTGINNITGNYISNLSTSSWCYGYLIQPVSGIWLTSSEAGQKITGNTICNLMNEHPFGSGNIEISISGIHFENGQGTIEQNLIYDFFPKQIIGGIALGVFLYSGSAVVMNNAIRLGYDNPYDNALVGIWSRGSHRILGNSVLITGIADEPGNGLCTYAYHKRSGDPDEVKNNIFINNRTTENDYAKHCAVGLSVPASIESDHNNLLGTAPNTVGNLNVDYEWYSYIGTFCTFEEWQQATGGDANSLNIDPQFVGAQETMPDLHITSLSLMIDMGTSVYPLIVDIDGDIRDQQPDIGCDEHFTGSVLVGQGQTYTTLKQAFDAINAGAITGNISINIQSSTAETETATLYQSGYNGTSNYTSISVGALSEDVTIAGNLAAPLISFNGAHNVNMVALAIENSNTHGYCIQFTNSAVSNRIAGCKLHGATQMLDAGLITFGEAGNGDGNNNNLIESCTFAPTSSNYRYGIVSKGSMEAGNSDNKISNSDISDFWSNSDSSAGIFLDANNANWTISGNSLYQTQSITSTGAGNQYGIYSLSADGINISDNHIGGSEPQCGDIPWSVEGNHQNIFAGILVNGQYDHQATISGNTIGNYIWVAAPTENLHLGEGIWNGIVYGSGTIAIADNTIGSTTENGNISISTTSEHHVGSHGIYGTSDGYHATISGNTIGGINVLSTDDNYTHSFVGIQNDGATEISINNNLIGSLETPKSINTLTPCNDFVRLGQHMVGIANNANTTSCLIDNNIIRNLYNSSLSVYSSQPITPIGFTVAGISVTNGVNFITKNTISKLSTSTAESNTPSAMGIYAKLDNTGQVISGNHIFDLLTTRDDERTILSGIYFEGINYPGSYTSKNLIEGNRIYNLKSMSSSATLPSQIYGIYIVPGLYTSLNNNMISLGSSINEGFEIYGIYCFRTESIFHNTVLVTGNVSGTHTGNSLAFWDNPAARDVEIRNNIFVNTRTSTNGSKNYAFGAEVGNIVLDHNAYWVNGTGTVLALNGSDDILDLPILERQDEHSINQPIVFNDDIAAAKLYSTTAALNAAAMPIDGITTDFDGNTRNPKYPDIGAHEFTQPLIPNLGGPLDFGVTDILHPTSPKSYELTGIDLSANLVVTAPENFQVSLNSDDNFAQSVSIPPINTNVEATIYARYLPQEEGFTYGDITHSCSGAVQTKYVQGSARAIPPLMATGSASNLTPETAEINGEIIHLGGRNAISRGVIYWPYNGEDLEIDDPDVSDVSEIGTFGIGEYSITLENLEIDTHYNYRSFASNGDWNFGGIGYGATLDFWTLADVPNAPIVNEITASKVRVALAEDENPIYTEHAIFETTTNRYVQTDGTVGTTAAWQTKDEWGEVTVTLYASQDLTGNREYAFGTIARNGVGIPTQMSETESFLTLAHVPNPPYIWNITEGSMQFSIYSNPNDYSFNTPNTEYAVVENNSGQYIQLDGTLGVDIQWETREQWDINLTGLSVATEYSFSSMARNDDGLETAPSLPTSGHTLAVVPAAPLATVLDDAKVTVSIAPNNNPQYVEYCIISLGSIYYYNKYIHPDGTLSDVPAWQTKDLWENTLVTAFDPNSTYRLVSKVRNGALVETDESEECSFVTTAIPPAAPSLSISGSSANQFQLAPGSDENPHSTQMAFQDSLSELYVQQDGTLGTTEVWQDKNSWNYANVQVNVATSYGIRGIAKNENGIETIFGPTSYITTYPYPAGIPVIDNVTSNSLHVDINPNGNPAHVEYAIRKAESQLFVQPDGSLDNAACWQTLDGWDIVTIPNLQPNEYIGFVTDSRSDIDRVAVGTEAAYARTLANIPGALTLEAVTSTSIRLTVNPNGNPNEVNYAIFETSMGKYLGHNSQFIDNPQWYGINDVTNLGVNFLLPLTEYTFKAKARNSDWVETDFGSEASVTTLDGPLASPTLISPENGATNLPNSILFSWSELNNAETYTIQLSEYSGFYEILFEESGIEGTEIQIENLEHGMTYCWRVNATNQHGEGAWSAVWSFTVMDGPPSTPVLQLPANGATEIPADTFLSWSMTNNTNGFNLQVSLDPDFSTLFIDSTFSANWNDSYYFYIYNQPHNTIFHWRVRSMNDHGASAWSEAWSYTTIDITPDVPQLISPENGAVDQYIDVALYWDWPNLAESFHLQISTDDNFENLLIDEPVDYTDYSVYNLQRNTIYHWRVRSENQWAFSEWSEIWWFKTYDGNTVPTEDMVELKVYPNPVNYNLNIICEAKIERVVIFSELGVIVDEIVGVEKTINTAHLKPGVYIFKIETQKGNALIRVVKQ